MNRKKNSVLIVDDERINISSLKFIISPEYTVYASSNGREAIETAEEFMPDIILLDVLMPDMDGYEVISALKSSEKTRDIPVIFITGLDNIEAEIKGLELGAADYISKPFHPAIVELRVQHHIQLVERLRQQALTAKIAHNFLTNAPVDSLCTDTLRMMGEFMGIASAALYKLDKNANLLICRNEWNNSDLNLESRIGDKFKLNEEIILSFNNLLDGDEKDLCLNSQNPLSKEISGLGRFYPENFIITPVFIKSKMNALLVFSRDDDQKWSESETGLSVLAASIFSGVFERDAIQHEEYLSRAKSEFLSRMSHEMRTPMNAIIGILQVFGVLGIPDNFKEHCNAMSISAHSLMRLIDDVLDISDMEYGAFKLLVSAFDFKKMAWDILREADEKASKKRKILECKVNSEIPDLLYGDEKRLRQVITALLDNACKFTPANGEINFDAAMINDDNGIITIQIVISDNGIGMSKEQQDNIFSLFEQADSGLNRKYGGMGIGLALSKRILEQMGGTISLESELGKGTRVCIAFKLKKEA
jgi:signal transduction histidine kinase/CheY-like chemotaxis protein